MQEVCLPAFLHEGLGSVDTRHGDEARSSGGRRGCDVGCCSLGTGLIWCGGMDSWRDCGCGGEPGSGHDRWISELGWCEESELVCGEMEFLRRLESDFFFLTFFMVDPSPVRSQKPGWPLWLGLLHQFLHSIFFSSRTSCLNRQGAADALPLHGLIETVSGPMTTGSWIL